jgi:hypothetical protein
MCRSRIIETAGSVYGFFLARIILFDHHATGDDLWIVEHLVDAMRLGGEAARKIRPRQKVRVFNDANASKRRCV